MFAVRVLVCVLLFGMVIGEDINIFIEDEMSSAHIAALSVVVVKNSSILFKNAYGLSNPNVTAGLVNNTNDTIFDLASISKTVTSFGVMSLYDKGLFKLDDAINKYLPFKIVNPYFPNTNITIRQLLTHMSSISDTQYFNIYPFIVVEGDSNITLTRFMYDMFNLNGKYYSKLSFHAYKPGAEWDYSNMGVTLVGYLAQCIIENNKNINYNTFDDYVRNEIFGKMGNNDINIQHIGFHLNDFIYKPNNTIFGMPSSWNPNKREYTTYCLYGYPDYPDGLWRSSAINYHTLFSTFINGGLSDNGIRILNQSTVNEMKTIQPNTPVTQEQGIIWYYRPQHNRRLIGHNGGDDGVCTEAFFNPKTGVGFIIFGNCDWDPIVTTAFQKIENKLLDIYDPNGGLHHNDNYHNDRNKTYSIQIRHHRVYGVTDNSPQSIMPCNLPI